MNNKYIDTPSPGFSKFRQLMDIWDKNLAIQEAEKSVDDLLNRHGLILFFKKDNDYFGAPEESRVIFAKLKDEDDDDPMNPGFRDEAKFMGMNLMKSMFGGPEDSVQTLFGIKDLPKIKVCDRDEIIKQIMFNKPEEKED